MRADMKSVRKGKELIGLSPFNQEKTPSFTVNDERGLYHCFSTGKSGDAITYLVTTEGMHHKTAVHFLETQYRGVIRIDKWRRTRRPKRRRTRRRGGEKRSPDSQT